MIDLIVARMRCGHIPGPLTASGSNSWHFRHWPQIITSKQDYLDETLLFICEYIRPEECDAVGPRLVTFGAKLAPQVLTAQCSPQSPCCTLLCPELSSVNTFPHHWLVKSDASKHLIGWLSIFNFQWVVVEGDFCFVVLTCTVTSRRMVACVIRVLKIYGGRGK